MSSRRCILRTVAYGAVLRKGMALEQTPLDVRVLEADDAAQRLFIVSDLHAYAEPLEALDSARAGYGEPTQVVAAGDLFL